MSAAAGEEVANLATGEQAENAGAAAHPIAAQEVLDPLAVLAVAGDQGLEAQAAAGKDVQDGGKDAGLLLGREPAGEENDRQVVGDAVRLADAAADFGIGPPSGRIDVDRADLGARGVGAAVDHPAPEVLGRDQVQVDERVEAGGHARVAAAAPLLLDVAEIDIGRTRTRKAQIRQEEEPEPALRNENDVGAARVDEIGDEERHLRALEVIHRAQLFGEAAEFVEPAVRRGLVADGGDRPAAGGKLAEEIEGEFFRAADVERGQQRQQAPGRAFRRGAEGGWVHEREGTCMDPVNLMDCMDRARKYGDIAASR